MEALRTNIMVDDGLLVSYTIIYSAEIVLAYRLIIAS